MKYLFYVVFITIFSATAFYTFVFAKGDKTEAVVVQENISRPYVIEINKADGSKEEKSGVSTSQTPFLIAKDLGINTIEQDKFTAFPDIAMNIGSTITMYETPYYQVNDGKKHYDFRSWSETVGELLKENNLELGLDDKINFSPDSEVENNMVITIIRVARTLVVENQSINFSTEKRKDPNLDEGKTRIEQAGVLGVRKLTYEVVREDGVQVSKTLKKSEIASEPVKEIVIIGTKPVITVACRFNDTVLAAAQKYNLSPNSLCVRMMKESRGNPSSDGGDYKGLFQYEEGFWERASSQAGYSGASIWDATAQIYTTAWAWSHGLRGRWPSD